MSTSIVSRDEFLTTIDVDIKIVTVPEKIKRWAGKSFYIKTLTRGEQDEYLNRQFMNAQLKQDARQGEQEIGGLKMFGHDAWLCVRGVCKDANGSPMFTDGDIANLNAKSGEFIGWLASEIVEHSGMKAEVKVARGEVTEKEQLAEDIKNS